MIRDLLPLGALILIAVLIWTLRARHRKLYVVDPPAPGLTMAEAWQLWEAGPRAHPDLALFPDVPAAVPAVRTRLEIIERQVNNSVHPRAAVRAAVLDAAGLALHLEAIARLGETERAVLLKGYTEGMDPQLREAVRASNLESLLLRYYAGLKYDDAVAGDWFHHYLRVAGPYITEKVRLAREHLVEVNEGAARFVEIYDKLLDQLRHEMLAAAPKKRFPPSDLPA